MQSKCASMGSTAASDTQTSSMSARKGNAGAAASCRAVRVPVRKGQHAAAVSGLPVHSVLPAFMHPCSARRGILTKIGRSSKALKAIALLQQQGTRRASVCSSGSESVTPRGACLTLLEEGETPSRCLIRVGRRETAGLKLEDLVPLALRSFRSRWWSRSRKEQEHECLNLTKQRATPPRGERDQRVLPGHEPSLQARLGLSLRRRRH